MTSLIGQVAAYYEEKLADFGASAQGVDWNGPESQVLRFRTVLGILPPGEDSGTLDDYGCGYGALFDHLKEIGRGKWDYLGLDVAADMVTAARARNPAESHRFVLSDRSPRIADYAVASGIFNVRLAIPDADWERHIMATLDVMHESTSSGFAFNCLTSYSDPSYRKDYLYYGDPCRYFDFCKTRYSRNVALLHDYGLYEFTLLVRKDPAI